MIGARARTTAYLWHTGAFSLLLPCIAVLVLVYAGYEIAMVGYSEEGVVLWLMFANLAVGTGLLSSSRAGRLDLLFGAGVSRKRVFVTAYTWIIGIAMIVAATLGAWSVHDRALAAAAAGRAAGVALFTVSTCFASGILEPRYALGVAWIGARITALMTHAGFTVYHELKAVSVGGARPPIREVVLLGIAFPEVMLQREVPAIVVVVTAGIGCAIVAIASLVFARAQFGGKRSI